jgi:hypothetical protein
MVRPCKRPQKSTTGTGRSTTGTSEVSAKDLNKTETGQDSADNTYKTTQVVNFKLELFDAIMVATKDVLPSLTQGQLAPVLEKAMLDNNNDIEAVLILMANVYRSAKEQKYKIDNPPVWIKWAVEKKWKPYRNPCKDVDIACMFLGIKTDMIKKRSAVELGVVQETESILEV